MSRRFSPATASVLLLLCAVWRLPEVTGQSLFNPARAAGRGNFSISCSSKLTKILDKTITISPASICKDFGMGRPTVITCTALDILDQTTKRVTGECKPHKQAPIKSVSATGKPIPTPLPDRRPLPAGKFSNEAALLDEEGATMYWYITNVINLFLWAPCKAAKDFITPWLVPDGWNMLAMEHTPPQGPDMAPLPMYTILKSADGKQLAVIIRGTRTAKEWQLDMTYLQGQDPNYPGMLSKGFLFGANLLWPMLEKTLQAEVVEGQVTDVTVAGHSLGAAMATLLSYRAQVFLDEQLLAANKASVAVGSLLFAPPNVGDDTFVSEFNKRVNGRRIAFAYDFVPQVPCAPHMMACQDSVFPTAVDGVTSWNYGQVGGDITFYPDAMPVQPEAWAKLDTINGCMMLPWGIASHVCSYPCMFSKYVGAEEYGRCKLWGAPSEKLGLGFRV